MKKAFNSFILLTGLLLLAACDNDPLNLPQVTDNASGMGRLTVDLDGTDGRTLLPQAPEFSRYALRFRYMAGGVSDINETADSLPFSIELVPGNWNVTVTGYVYIENVEGIVDGHYIAASGEKTVTIEAGISTPVTVDLYRRSGVKGVFQYDIGLPTAGLNGANLNILRTNRTVVATKNLLEAASGSIALDEGYYFAQVRVVTGRVRSKTELIHVYSGHTTVAAGAAWDFDTEEGVFLSPLELSEYLSYAQANTANNPYPVKLITDWTALSTPNEFLGQMYAVLNGRYISVDLSETTSVNGIVDTTVYSANRNRLVSVVLPEGLTEINDSVFYNCTALTGVTIPASVTSIGSNAFDSCTGLQTINVNSNNTVYNSVDGILYNKNLTVLIMVPQGITGTVTIPDSVTSIGDQAFYNRTGLVGVIIGNGVTGIGDSAFDGCAALTGVTIPDSVTSIGNYAFRGCAGLENVIIGNGVTSLNGFSFSGNTNLTSVTIGNKITSIGSSAFDGCTGLADVTIPDSVTSIGNDVFRGCAGLTSLTIPDSVTSIANNTFYGCSGLTSLTIPDSVTSIGSSAFSGYTGLTSVIIPDSVTSIENYAFDGCSGLTNVTFNGVITSSNFSSTSPFPGNLRTKYLDGGLGTYITTNPGSGAVWTKGNIASITVPSWHEGNAISLVTPLIVFPAGETVTAQGWQISDNASDGWTNFSLPATADMSYHGKYLRYYAAFSGGQTYYSNVVILIVIQTVVVTNTGEWNAAVNTIRNGGNDHAYIINVSGDVGVTGSTADSFGTATGITVTLTGSGKLYLTSRGRIITLAADQTLIIDSADLVLQGLKNGQNGATQDNNTAVVYVNGSNAQLELRNGTIRGNTSSSSGGGVYVGGGTFTMYGGEISGNTAVSESYHAYGGGVYVGGTFTMTGGEISGNTAVSRSGGGIAVSGTFRIVTGTVYGNTAGTGGAALYNGGTAQRGTFSGETWVSAGNLSNTDNTIRVVNGALQ